MHVADTSLFQGFPGVEGAEWMSCTAEVAALWKLISGSVLLPHGGITFASRNLLTSPASGSFLDQNSVPGNVLWGYRIIFCKCCTFLSDFV